MYKRILLAVDGSDHSIRAAEHAATLAKAMNGAVEIAYVADFSKSKEAVLYVRGHSDLEMQRRQRLLPAEELLITRQVPYEVNILHGEPGPAIVDHANAHSFDLVIIGSRGLNPLQEMVLGSVSHKVMKRSDCPVMIIK
ncbi:universal stress protein [Bhargavaea beijingensis]|uniref:Universal stress protein n=1 Tax=Bhargavaea beijingensis TaxID=426756 RepID=A0A1G7GFP0_9BACL|nr:universal stress protein [Bhargavaea beijingensis]MCW1929315.1 universal stress protein [Bhargavaea beijingensis]RSK29745.1 universal stress protein [Bhargavaea beijingensis]SDE86936.1 Nucleotide-binding universal stress protein, UspA family [Bhargavaea beijingensis]